MSTLIPAAPIPEPPAHPSPAEMAAELFPNDGRLRLAGKVAIIDERKRLAERLRFLSAEHRESAALLNDPAPANLSAALDAAEHIGAARALLDLAGELDPAGGGR